VKTHTGRGSQDSGKAEMLAEGRHIQALHCNPAACCG